MRCLVLYRVVKEYLMLWVHTMASKNITKVTFSQVPLVVFKREKEVARKLEFDGLYITEQPSEDDIKGQWDRLVINTPYVK